MQPYECGAVMIFVCVRQDGPQPSVPGSHRYNSHRIVDALQAIIRILRKSCLPRAPHEINRNQRGSETTTTEKAKLGKTLSTPSSTHVSHVTSAPSRALEMLSLSAPPTAARICVGCVQVFSSVYTVQFSPSARQPTEPASPSAKSTPNNPPPV